MRPLEAVLDPLDPCERWEDDAGPPYLVETIQLLGGNGPVVSNFATARVLRSGFFSERRGPDEVH